MSDTSIKNSSYPMELVGLIVKTNNFDTNLTVDLATTKGGSFQKVYNVKYQRKDASMSNEMTLTVACEDFYTKLIIPNNKLTQEHIENWSHGSELSRFIIKLNVAYGTDTQLVSRLLKQAALSHPRVKKNMPVDVRLANFGDNGMDIELLFWADQSWDINFYKSDIRMEIDRLFREYHIVIPFPQRDIHIVSKDQ